MSNYDETAHPATTEKAHDFRSEAHVEQNPVQRITPPKISLWQRFCRKLSIVVKLNSR